MLTAVAVNKLEAKSLNAADETRTPEKTRFEIVRFEDYTIGRMTLEPGWRWSECIKPHVHTDSCQLSHVGYAVSGRLVVRMEDGNQMTINAGDSYTIPPGHDAWNEGTEPFVGLEMLSAEQYGKP